MFSDTIRHAAKSTVVVAAIIIAIVVTITGVLQLVSSHLHDGPEELYNFATAAKRFHEKIEGTGLLEDIATLTEVIAHESSDNSSEIEASIQQGMLSARGYRDQFNWLSPTTDSLELFESLVREGRLIGSCYSRLNLAWSEKQAGDEAQCAQHLEEVRALYDEVVVLREQNKLNLDNLMAQSEQERSH